MSLLQHTGFVKWMLQVLMDVVLPAIQNRQSAVVVESELWLLRCGFNREFGTNVA